MSKHTQGPWAHRNGRIFQTDRDVLTIANVARAADGDYSAANGRLLAAAPMLLDALKLNMELLEKFNAFKGEEELLQIILLMNREVIAKAVGGAQ